MNVKYIAIFFALSIFIFVMEMIREEKLTFKYAFTWLIVSVSAIYFSIFNKVLFKISHIAGFELPSNFIFFSMLSALIFLSLVITVFLCQQNRRNDKIAQKVAILENELEKLKKKVNNFS